MLADVASVPFSDLPSFDPGEVLGADDPFAALDGLREEAPLWRSTFGLHVMTFDGGLALLRDDRFHRGVPQMLDRAGIVDPAVRRQWTISMLGSPKADHDRMRRLVSPSFTPRAIAALRERVAEVAVEAADIGAVGGRSTPWTSSPCTSRPPSSAG